MTSEGIVASHNDGVKPQPGCFLHTIRFRWSPSKQEMRSFSSTLLLQSSMRLLLWRNTRTSLIIEALRIPKHTRVCLLILHGQPTLDQNCPFYFYAKYHYDIKESRPIPWIYFVNFLPHTHIHYLSKFHFFLISNMFSFNKDLIWTTLRIVFVAPSDSRFSNSCISAQ